MYKVNIVFKAHELYKHLLNVIIQIFLTWKKKIPRIKTLLPLYQVDFLPVKENTLYSQSIKHS